MGGYKIHSPIEGLLHLTGTEPTQNRNSASKVAGLQMHATTSLTLVQKLTLATFR